MSATKEALVRHVAPAYRWREDFPVLKQQVYGKPLVYLDNAATSQKPAAVIEAERRYYEEYNANVHRGVHALSQKATDAYEGAREKVARFLNARSAREIVFVRGCTEGVNLVAQSYGRAVLKPGDEVLITAMEHHSNIVPWQMACQQTGAVLKVAPINDAGEMVFEEFERLLSERTKIVAAVHVSNALGTINPVGRIVERAHAVGAKVLLDGAQAAPHVPVDVQALDCDFYALSGHKIYGPTGIGALYGKEALLAAMPPYQGGGDMIKVVTFEKTLYNDLPYKFEAGTPHIAGAIGLGAALDYVAGIGMEAIAAHEHALLEYATEAVAGIKGLRLVGTARQKAGILSFVMDGVHPHDIGTILDHQGVAIRAGHHCAMPVMDRYGVPATARASFALYNTREDVDALVAGLRKVQEVFG
ncbi:SufS family cysteine desulfurase [Pelomicrobium sp. G1]|uniref:cysteine desulfurase n=1 Tax=unclassified Pelomicrobium TaxID=2815318 RepID=UPI000AEE0306|nr:MAG: cysteine desulfurase [Burkholderiales bacterium]